MRLTTGFVIVIPVSRGAHRGVDGGFRMLDFGGISFDVDGFSFFETAERRPQKR